MLWDAATHSQAQSGQKRRPSNEEGYDSDEELVANDDSDVDKGRSNKKQKGKRRSPVNDEKEQFWVRYSKDQLHPHAPPSALTRRLPDPPSTLEHFYTVSRDKIQYAQG